MPPKNADGIAISEDLNQTDLDLHCLAKFVCLEIWYSYHSNVFTTEREGIQVH